MKGLKESTDALMALQCVLEGEATVVMTEALMSRLPEEARGLFGADGLSKMVASLAAGDTKYRGQTLPTKALKADGSTIYVELSFAIVHGADDAVVGAMAQARDITERFERDRAARRRLRELQEALDKAAASPA